MTDDNQSDIYAWLRDAVLISEFLRRATDAPPQRRARARELMMHYIYGNGGNFEREGGTWGEHMRSVPELKEARENFYRILADKLTNDGKEKSGTFEENVGEYIGRQIALATWPEMRLTLYGAHDVSAKGQYEVIDERDRFKVRFYDTTWTWYDEGDLHPDKATELPYVPVPIPDAVFQALGWAWGGQSYPIEISWQYDGTRTVPKETSRCGVKCKDYEKYGLCDRMTYDEICWQHA